MSYRPPKVLITGSFPDALNVNVALRGYLIDGFRKALPDSTVLGAPYEGAAAAARERFEPMFAADPELRDRADAYAKYLATKG